MRKSFEKREGRDLKVLHFILRSEDIQKYLEYRYHKISLLNLLFLRVESFFSIAFMVTYKVVRFKNLPMIDVLIEFWEIIRADVGFVAAALVDTIPPT